MSQYVKTLLRTNPYAYKCVIYNVQTNMYKMKLLKISTYLLPLLLLLACSNENSSAQKGGVYKVDLKAPKGKAIAAFAEGCFWCSEHIFESVVGVDSAVSGYAGGHTDDPTYDKVNTETTGHAETVLVYYDPNVISYKELLNVFYASHDPTTPNQQGPDVGNSYRSISFYNTPEERATAMAAKDRWDKSGVYAKMIVTEIKPLEAFYRAEGYHQDYIEHNPNNPYVRNVSIPRYKKFKEMYKGKLK